MPPITTRTPLNKRKAPPKPPISQLPAPVTGTPVKAPPTNPTPPVNQLPAPIAGTRPVNPVSPVNPVKAPPTAPISQLPAPIATPTKVQPSAPPIRSSKDGLSFLGGTNPTAPAAPIAAPTAKQSATPAAPTAFPTTPQYTGQVQSSSSNRGSGVAPAAGDTVKVYQPGGQVKEVSRSNLANEFRGGWSLDPYSYQTGGTTTPGSVNAQQLQRLGWTPELAAQKAADKTQAGERLNIQKTTGQALGMSPDVARQILDGTAQWEVTPGERALAPQVISAEETKQAQFAAPEDTRQAVADEIKDSEMKRLGLDPSKLPGFDTGQVTGYGVNASEVDPATGRPLFAAPTGAPTSATSPTGATPTGVSNKPQGLDQEVEALIKMGIDPPPGYTPGVGYEAPQTGQPGQPEGYTPGNLGIYAGKEGLYLNKEAVNELFSKYHNKDANAEELAYWSGYDVNTGQYTGQPKKIGDLESALANTTIYSGEDADKMRADMATSGQDYISNQAELEKFRAEGGTTTEGAGSMLFAAPTGEDIDTRGSGRPLPEDNINTGVQEDSPIPNLPDEVATSDSPEGQNQLSSSQTNIENLSAPGKNEQYLELELSNFQSNVEAGMNKIEDQTIPMEFIVGQQASLQRIVQAKENTLTRKLAIAQADRLADLEMAKLQHEWVQEEQARQDQLNSPIQMGDSIVQMNPETGQYEAVYTAPKEEISMGGILDLEKQQLEIEKLRKEIDSSPNELDNIYKKAQIDKIYSDIAKSQSGISDGKAPVVKNINGVDSQWNPETQKWDSLSVANKEKNKASADVLNSKIDLIDSLLSSKGLSGSVGTYKISRWTPFSVDQAERQDFAAGINQLISTETLDTLIHLKSQGGTLGAISEKELDILQTSATKINVWVQKDKNGNATGKFEVSEELFKAELNKIRDSSVNLRDALVGTGEDQDFLDEFGSGGSVEDIFSDFSQDLGMSEKGSSFLANFGQITAEGSPLWKHGLDIDLKIGDPVPSPVSGTVTAAVESGGFGNRVKILADNGKEYWLSHLDSMNVKEGDKIAMGDIVGAGGNSGSVIPMGGGDGSHLDLTVVDKDGEFITPSQIRQMFS